MEKISPTIHSGCCACSSADTTHSGSPVWNSIILYSEESGCTEEARFLAPAVLCAHRTNSTNVNKEIDFDIFCIENEYCIQEFLYNNKTEKI